LQFSPSSSPYNISLSARSFTIYSDGYFEFYPADCTAGWFDAIDLGDLSTNISRRENLIQSTATVKRDATPFNVELIVKDYCGETKGFLLNIN
jgi:hypothetical protein